jgi:chromosome segregation ATPase
VFKNYFIAGFVFFVIIISIKNIFYVPSGELSALQERTTNAETQLAQTNERLDKVRDLYVAVVDSLRSRSDSLNTVIVDARSAAVRASSVYDRRSEELVDSLRNAGNEIIASELELLRASHDSVVVAMNTEIAALKEERSLLWQRVAMADSLIETQSMQIQALEAVSEGLRNERDAWRAKASPSLPKRLMGQAPAILAGAVLAGIVR